MADATQLDNTCFETWNYTNVTSALDNLDRISWGGVDKLVIVFILPIISIAGILMNFAFLFTVATVPRMQMVTNFYLVNLSAADILFLMFTLGSYVHTYLHSALRNNVPYLSDFGCWGNFYPIYLSYYASVLIITLVSLERFMVICMPVKYRLIKGKARTVKWIAACWGLSLVLAALSTPRYGDLRMKCILWPDTEAFASLPRLYRSCYLVSNAWALASEIIQTLLFLIAMFTSCITYYKLIVTLHQKMAPVGRRRSSRGDREHRNRQERNQVARLLVVNGLVFFICQFPARVINIDKVVRAINGNLQVNFAALLGIANGCLLINSAINPIIYGLSSRMYRVAFCEAFGIARLLKLERKPSSGSRSLSQAKSNESLDRILDSPVTKKNLTKSMETLDRDVDSPAKNNVTLN